MFSGCPCMHASVRAAIVRDHMLQCCEDDMS